MTAAASLSLGYRGESALVHGIVLLIAIALFLAEVVGALIIAALADSRKHNRAAGVLRRGRPFEAAATGRGR